MKPSESKVLLTVIKLEDGQTAIDAKVAKNFSHVVLPGTKQREVLNNLSFGQPVFVRPTPDEQFVIDQGIAIPMVRTPEGDWESEEQFVFEKFT